MLKRITEKTGVTIGREEVGEGGGVIHPISHWPHRLQFEAKQDVLLTCKNSRTKKVENWDIVNCTLQTLIRLSKINLPDRILRNLSKLGRSFLLLSSWCKSFVFVSGLNVCSVIFIYVCQWLIFWVQFICYLLLRLVLHLLSCWWCVTLSLYIVFLFPICFLFSMILVPHGHKTSLMAEVCIEGLENKIFNNQATITNNIGYRRPDVDDKFCIRKTEIGEDTTLKELKNRKKPTWGTLKNMGPISQKNGSILEKEITNKSINKV